MSKKNIASSIKHRVMPSTWKCINLEIIIAIINFSVAVVKLHDQKNLMEKKEFYFSLWSRGLEPVTAREAWQQVARAGSLQMLPSSIHRKQMANCKKLSNPAASDALSPEGYAL